MKFNYIVPKAKFAEDKVSLSVLLSSARGKSSLLDITPSPVSVQP